MVLLHEAKLLQLFAPLVHSSTSEKRKQTSNLMNLFKETEGEGDKHPQVVNIASFR